MKRIILLILLCAGGLSAQTIHSNLSYRESDDPYAVERCKLDIWLPDGVTDFPTVVWFHGGGLRNGNKHFPPGLLNRKVAVVSVNYRLNPKVQSPGYVEDAAAAVAWVLKHIEQYGGNSNLVFLSGHSAGGYLASMVGLDKSYLAAFGIDADCLAGLIPLSGHTITHLTVRAERGISRTQPIVDEMAPLFHVRPDAPPLLLITGDREMEMLGRYEENAYMMRMMRVAGHPDTRIMELDGYGHGIIEPACPLVINEVRRLTQKFQRLEK